MSYLGTTVLSNQVEEEARRQGVNPLTARGILLSENSYFDKNGAIQINPQVSPEQVSSKDARGIMQVIPTTAQALIEQGFLPATIDLSSPAGQLQAGVAAIKELASRGITNPIEQAVAYNGGGNALAAYRAGKPLNPETTDYVKKFTAHTGSTSSVSATGTRAMPNSSTSTSTRESTSTSTLTLPPGVADMLTQDTMSARAATNDMYEQIKAMTSGILSNAQDMRGAIDAETAGKKATSDATADITSAKQATAEGIASAFGINLNDPSQTAIRDATQIIEANRVERQSLSQQITALRSNSTFLTDPVGWLADSIKQLPLIQRHNALVKQSDESANAIAQAQALATAQSQIQPAPIADALQRKKLGDANTLIAEGEKQKAQVTGAARASVAQTLLQQQHLLNTNLDNEFKYAGIIGDRTSSLDSSSDKETKASKAEDDLLNGVNKVTAAFSFPAFNKLTFGRLDKPMQDALIKTTQFTKDGEPPRLGRDVGESVANLYEMFGNTGITYVRQQTPVAGAALAKVVDRGQKEVTALRDQAAAKPGESNPLHGIKSPVDELKIGINRVIDRDEQELKKGNMASVSQDNSFRLNYDLAAGSDTLKGNPYAAYVAGRPKNVRPDDQLILSKAVADIAVSKKPVGQVAQEIQDFYRKGMENQYKQQNMRQLGFKDIGSYPVVTKVNTLMGDKVDMFSRESVEQWLVKQVASQHTSEVIQQVGDALNNAYNYGN